MEVKRDRAIGCMLGLAVGDALGAAVEFESRDSFEPVTGYRGGGAHRLEPGLWTDDTSMALCLADSLIASGLGPFDPADLMRRFGDWYTKGHRSSTGRCFDIGTTTRTSIDRFLMSGMLPELAPEGPPTNGSLMRLAPAAIRHHRDDVAAIKLAEAQSDTTHWGGAPYCRMLAYDLQLAINGRLDVGEFEHVASKRRDEIRSGGLASETLEAAVWSFATSSSFEEAVLKAVNLGDDSDTVGAVAGQLAGAYWGLKSIPEAWARGLHESDQIVAVADRLYDLGSLSAVRADRRK